jgi:protein-tyrosine-phosphatase
VDEGGPSKRIQSVLFVCAWNSVRSPMAEALARHYFGKSVYVQSAGVRKGDTDGFMVAALEEVGIDVSKHKPRTLDELEEWEGLNFDLIVSLSPEAHHAALELTRTIAAEVEYWPTNDPTIIQGTREQMLDAYRDVRDGLSYRIRLKLKQAP